MTLRGVSAYPILFVGVVVCWAGGVGFAAGRARPPGQPKTGPGGADYAHAKVRMTRLGRGGTGVWVFEPAQPSPKTAPVVIFLHGWASWKPVAYRRWLDHIARRGNIVIYPRYQASLVTMPTKMTHNATIAVHDALNELRKTGHVRPDETKVAVVGHSLGAVIAANIAATAKRIGLPPPRAVMCIQPGDPPLARFVKKAGIPLPSILGDYSKIPAGTLMLVIVSDRDRVVGDLTAKTIWKRIRHLPAKDRAFISLMSDEHGSPKLRARHICAIAPTKGSIIERIRDGTDALDYYGTWRLLDALTDAAFYGTNRKYALGNTPEQRYMGKWSDGTPVKELRILSK